MMPRAAASTLPGPAFALLAFGLLAVGDAGMKALSVRNPPLQIAFLSTVSAAGLVALWALRHDWASLKPRHPALIGLRATFAGWRWLHMSREDLASDTRTMPALVVLLARPA